MADKIQRVDARERLEEEHKAWKIDHPEVIFDYISMCMCMLPQKILKISVLRLAGNAFPTF